VTEVAATFGVSEDQLDTLFTLERADGNAPEPFPTPISYRDALAHYMDLDATPSPAALAAFAEAIEESDPDASDKLHRLAGARTHLSYQSHYGNTLCLPPWGGQRRLHLVAHRKHLSSHVYSWLEHVRS
jgi:hypothetical protein